MGIWLISINSIAMKAASDLVQQTALKHNFTVVSKAERIRLRGKDTSGARDKIICPVKNGPTHVG
jgi:hypothetical protein